jgi:hypothetical protein
MIAVAENEVIQNWNAQNLCSGEQLASQQNVFLAGINVTGWMIVGDDDAGGALADDFSEDVAWVG